MMLPRNDGTHSKGAGMYSRAIELLSVGARWKAIDLANGAVDEVEDRSWQYLEASRDVL